MEGCGTGSYLWNPLYLEPDIMSFQPIMKNVKPFWHQGNLVHWQGVKFEDLEILRVLFGCFPTYRARSYITHFLYYYIVKHWRTMSAICQHLLCCLYILTFEDANRCLLVSLQPFALNFWSCLAGAIPTIHTCNWCFWPFEGLLSV